MSKNEQDKKDKKEAMKKLRASRKVFIKSASAKMKAHKKVIGAIKDQLQQEAKTVPEIAAATGTSPAETLWFVATLKKYGEIKEAEKDGSYFKYALTGHTEAEATN
jgi:predicted Rossmann fold nucleotide-binding protein DprA/Smf involved in DNA uptake